MREWAIVSLESDRRKIQNDGDRMISISLELSHCKDAKNKSNVFIQTI